MAKSAALQILSKKKAQAEPEAATDETMTPGDEVVDTAASEAEAGSEETETSTATKPKAAKTSAKPKGGTTVTTKAKTTTVSDEIADTATQIENLDETTAFKELTGLLHSQTFDEFRMGGILSKIQLEGWFGEHPNFRSLVEAEFGIQYRRAMMWVAMYNNLVESGVPYSKLKRLGWTKIALLSPILTQENVDDILKTVDGMNALQIGAYVQSYNQGDATPTSAPSDVSELKSKTFKLFPGQKETIELALEKAKKEANTDSDSAALDFICTDFAAGTKKKAPAATKTVTEVKIPETKDELVAVFTAKRESAEDLQTALTDILEAVNDVFPEAQIEVALLEEDA